MRESDCKGKAPGGVDLMDRRIVRQQADIDVAIIGAGPYGLSIAAHLAAKGVDHAVFGEPMGYWRNHMPVGMLLKSEGEASSLHDPDRSFSLQRYCQGAGIRYAPCGVPVSLQDFIAYGLAFRKLYAPTVYTTLVTTITRTSRGFRLDLQDGSSLSARAVVVAIGLIYFSRIPNELSDLPPELLTHSSEPIALDRFKGRQIVVIGAGASAVDIATLLHEAGAAALLVAREQKIQFFDRMQYPRPWWACIRSPMSAIGPSWRSLFYAEAPDLFHLLPQAMRLPRAKRYLGPSAGWSMRERFGPVPQLKGYRLLRTKVVGGRARLTFVGNDGAECEIDADHVIAATGFCVDLRRVPFLGPVRAQIETVEHTPVLSSSFESSVPGLYFVGPASTNSFGPVMRFVYGAKFAAARVARARATIAN